MKVRPYILALREVSSASRLRGGRVLVTLVGTCGVKGRRICPNPGEQRGIHYTAQRNPASGEKRGENQNILAHPSFWCYTGSTFFRGIRLISQSMIGGRQEKD